MGKWTWQMGAMLALVVAAGCGSAEEKPTGKEANGTADKELNWLLSEPVVLDVYIHTGGYKREQFMAYYGDAIRAKYPNFDFRLHVPDKGSSLQELLAQGVNIDLIQSHRANTFELMYDLKLQTDISDLITKYKYNLNAIEPVVLEEMRQLGGGGIMGLPYESRVNALFYNKQLFDKFGVPYPGPNQTWGDTLDLARRLSRTDGGAQYYGFLAFPRHVFLMNQLSQGYVDASGEKAALNNTNWKQLFDMLALFHRLPNNPFLTPGQISNTFWADGRSAMYASMFVPDAAYILNTQIDWDVAPYPAVQGKPGISSGMLNYYFNLTSIGKNREQGFLAAAFLASEEYQLVQAGKGYNPSLQGLARKQLGKDVPQYASRNLQAMVTDKPAGSYPVSRYQSIVDKTLDSAFNAMFEKEKDSNTALREAEEEANRLIRQAQANGG
ncbi:ABC transporter substrate-binding protein [Paenibacillus sp. GYB004]|uniref:ABC transporter substrate-binding protein n=1 Tax=Paenibacillus sp. GYB004 TaxID=2994393 RepID=UPI002F96AD23